MNNPAIEPMLSSAWLQWSKGSPSKTRFDLEVGKGIWDHFINNCQATQSFPEPTGEVPENQELVFRSSAMRLDPTAWNPYSFTFVERG